ncbi:DUF4335 domain-containing protein [Brasilonema sp. UFV-L1]|uniref:DUF4335 domain-containing protein n=1 Tax=Brasilonema sp. UFV-L1 TaxID=2234130 RepID=UPI00145DC0A3|nr:DUF4335 domain-containing protein [Brasilonema sp. UFV-L1]NMG08688.1 hypothetical protein [Brasilonema sp. UFV-L1]
MPVSNSVIRRYTPPTCTLEVLAQSSALSQWTNKSVLKQLQFELRFDDPRLPEEKRIAIRGDSDQLETLCAVVTGYVQEFMQMSPESFWANFSGASFSRTEDVDVVSDETELVNFNNFPSQETQTINSFTRTPHADIQIKPSNHLTHNLYLGSLANPVSGNVIQLSLLQLFDLATALDEYSADVMALPDTTPRSARRGVPAWAPVAAVLVIAVGLAPVTWQYANRVRQQEAARARKQTSPEQKIALEPSPAQPLSTPTALPTFAPSNSFPPLPPVGSTSSVPTSKVSPPITQSLPSLPATPSLPSVPATPQTSAKSTLSSVPVPKTSPTLGGVSQAPLPPLGTTLNIPGTTKIPTLSTSPSNTVPEQQIALQPKPQPNAAALKPLMPKSQSSSTSIEKNTNTNTTLNNLPSTNNTPNDLTASSAPATLPEPTASSSREPVYSQPGTPERSVGTDALISRLREARRSRANLSTEVATTNTGRGNDTLFDTVQVSEARDVLKKRWQPPSGLSQSIEYSLVVGIDGKIERILPLGKAARDYVDRTGLPLIGEPFVSPNRNGQASRIRAVFSPDGKVQTFPDQ